MNNKIKHRVSVIINLKLGDYGRKALAFLSNRSNVWNAYYKLQLIFLQSWGTRVVTNLSNYIHVM